MPKRFKVFKDQATNKWMIQEYGTTLQCYAYTFGMAVRAVLDGYASDAHYVRLDATDGPLLQQDEGRCSECGRRLDTWERANPGGGGNFGENCTHCEYSYSDGF